MKANAVKWSQIKEECSKSLLWKKEKVAPPESERMNAPAQNPESQTRGKVGPTTPPNNSVEDSKADAGYATIGGQATGKEQANDITECNAAGEGAEAIFKGDLFEEDYVMIEKEFEGSEWTFVRKQ